MNVKEIIADSHFAFLNQENEVALNLAKQAIKLDSKNPEAYKCAANANMSLERYDEAVKNYSLALKYDPNNGNRYYDLGFALTSAGKIAEAMRNFVKAEELGCTPENIVQLYNLLGIICFDIGRYDDAIINFNKAEQLLGVDLDILQRKAVIYGMKDDIRSGLLTANQIKMLAPSDYKGYQIAFSLLLQADLVEAAGNELDKAQKYAVPTMDFYFDSMTFELEKYKRDNDKEHFGAALALIENALLTLKPTVVNVIESYINAAEIYLQLENPDRTIDCLNAALNPAGAFNNGFEIIAFENEAVILSEYEIEDMIEADRERIANELGDYGLEEMVESIDPDEDGGRDYLTEIDDGLGEAEEKYKLDESEEPVFSQENIDQINRLYVGAYTLKKDFNKVVEYARLLQASDNPHNSYIGIYTEANAIKEQGLPEAENKYNEAVKFFRNAMIKDPTDILAVTFRIQCYIDMGNYDEAEEVCELLTKEIKEPLIEKIEEARAGGD